MMSTMSAIFHLQAFLILCLMILGIGLRRRRRLHVPIMSAVIVWDLVLVLQIELFRDAIFKASRFMENSWLLNVHILLAVSTLVTYGFALYTGRRLLKNDNSIRKFHQRVGGIAFSLRVLTFATGLTYTLIKEIPS